MLEILRKLTRGHKEIKIEIEKIDKLKSGKEKSLLHESRKNRDFRRMYKVIRNYLKNLMLQL